MKKYKLRVLYGGEACDWADEHASYIKGAIRSIKAGNLFGDYKEYEFDTEHDREVALNILSDSNGWDNNMWEEWEE